MDNIALEAVSQNLYGLIAQERAEKLDLLEQLILNQKEAVVVCGAEGIGKTTFLNALKKEKKSIGVICLLQGREILGFEQIKTALVMHILQHNTELVSQDLQFILSFCEQRQQKVVLMIDDASNLADGLITKLMECAFHNPALRIVFSFTREELFLKNIADIVLEGCYLIDIPAFTKSQTLLFLRDLSVFPESSFVAQEMSDKLISKLYQQTDGIPGKIIAKLPLLLESQHKAVFTPLKTILIVSIVLMSAVLFKIRNKSFSNQANTQTVSGAKPVKTAAKENSAIIAATQRQNPENTPVSSSVKVPQTLTAPPNQITKPTDSNKAAEMPIDNQPTSQDDDTRWVSQQIAEKYTLQLMALSSRQALLNIVKKYPNLQTELKILPVKSRNQQRYVLLYGSFADSKTAYAAVSSLPIEFRQAWPRRFNALQKSLKN